MRGRGLVGSVQFADEARRIAETFVEARREGRGLPEFPGDIPAGLDQAYAVQDHAIAFDGRPIGGWKVGRINPPLGGVDRLAGPIFTDRIGRGDLRRAQRRTRNRLLETRRHALIPHPFESLDRMQHAAR